MNALIDTNVILDDILNREPRRATASVPAIGPVDFLAKFDNT